jgi:hypothetical protein
MYFASYLKLALLRNPRFLSEKKSAAADLKELINCSKDSLVHFPFPNRVRISIVDEEFHEFAAAVACVRLLAFAATCLSRNHRRTLPWKSPPPISRKSSSPDSPGSPSSHELVQEVTHLSRVLQFGRYGGGAQEWRQEPFFLCTPCYVIPGARKEGVVSWV